MESTLAAAEAAFWEAQWRDHRLHCPQCTTAARQRSAKNVMCATGRPIYVERNEANANYKTQKELDRQPTPGQEALFT